MALLRLAPLLVLSLSLSLSLLLGPAHAKPRTTSEVIWAMQKRINASENYRNFQKYFYASTAPLALFDLIESGASVTVLVPSNKALAKIPESVKTHNVTFGAIVLFNSLKGRVTVHDLSKARIGATWKSLYANADVTKVVAATKSKYGLKISGAIKSSAVVDVRKGNFFQNGKLYCHGGETFGANRGSFGGKYIRLGIESLRGAVQLQNVKT